MTMPALERLPASEATIQERQVSVSVLTIGTKQVTQSLYKQIATEYVIDVNTGLLKGKVWGWINLHGESIKGWICNVNHPHYHVIWENNGQLRRCAVEQNYMGHYRSTGNGIDDTEFAWSSPNHKASYQAIKDAGQLFIAVSGVWK